MAAKKKKKKAAKRKKKTAERKSTPNPLKLDLTCKKAFDVDGGKRAYSITAKGSGHVVAGSEADARKKAKAFLRRRLK